MALFGFNSSRYEMATSVCFTCLCNSTHGELRCVGILISTNDYVLAEVMPASVFAPLCTLLYTKPMLTQNCSVTRQSSRTELHFRHRVPYSSGWIASPYKRLSQLALNLVASPASQAYVERFFWLCGDLSARKRNRTRMSLNRRVFPKPNRLILH